MWSSITIVPARLIREEEFYEYGKKFADLVKSKGAQPVFMQTWAYKSNPLMQPAITAAYGNLRRKRALYWFQVRYCFKKYGTGGQT